MKEEKAEKRKGKRRGKEAGGISLSRGRLVACAGPDIIAALHNAVAIR
jgi:hypothetical protein